MMELEILMETCGLHEKMDNYEKKKGYNTT